MYVIMLIWAKKKKKPIDLMFARFSEHNALMP